MDKGAQSATLLAPFRALDLTDEKGLLCGKILGDLGVDVIKVEKPGGDPARRIGPFYKDIPDPEKSLFWWAYNSNKKGITLNLESARGRDLFLRLVQKADFVIESFPPGYMKKLGLDYPALQAINPRIILTSITPFGQEGPYSHYKADDIVVLAMGGFLNLIGDPDRPPLQIGFPQAYFHASMEAVVGTVLAHYWRQSTGEGQYVDVSAQSSLLIASGYHHIFWEIYRQNGRRVGRYLAWLSGGRAKQRMIYPCKDGYITFIIYGGGVGGYTNRTLVEWMDSEGMAPDFLKEKDWFKLDMETVSQQEFDRIGEAFTRFFQRHTKVELYDGALQRGMMLYPVSSIKDIKEDSQLSSRGFWEEVEYPELGEAVSYPGAFVKLNEASCAIRRRAPLVGEHDREIYQGELGMTEKEMKKLQDEGVI